jgi:hypothetical protein
LKFEVIYLAYGTPNDDWAQYIPVAINGVLSELKRVTERLLKKYRWQEAQATVFVLSGIPPKIPAVFHILGNNHITLEIDPTTTPRQIAAVRQKPSPGN